MSNDLQERLKARLLEEKARLERDLEDFAKKDAKAPGGYTLEYPESGGSSDDDNAMEVSNYADELSLGEKLESELRDVKKALDAIEKGAYGTCKYCGKPIDEKRLEARPTSSACITCKKTLTQEM
jgi:RNA polymerase-binding transcription factor DksA